MRPLRTEQWALSAEGRKLVDACKLAVGDEDLALELAEKMVGADALYDLPSESEDD